MSGEARKCDETTVTPRTTTIGSYPVFPRAEDIEYYEKIQEHGLGDEVVDPFLWTIEETIRDYTAAGIEVVTTGQTRGDLYSLFLDPKFVKGIEWRGAEVYVSDRLRRVSSLRVSDVKTARNILPDYFELKEPITDAYTLAKFAKINTSSYTDARELAADINKRVIIPEIEDLQKEGSVSMIQLDSPSLAPESSPPDYVLKLYEEVANAVKLPLLVHACGDTTRIFRMLTKMKVDTLLLDFYHYPRLMEEAAKKGYDQTIGIGALDAQSPRLETVDEIGSVLQRARKMLGDDRVKFVHPHCGERSIDRQTAFMKNSNLTMARDDVYFGEAKESRPHRLGKREYDPKGYFLVSVRRDTREIVVSFYTYHHKAMKRFRSRYAETMLQAINEEADHLGISRRHLAYLTLELGRAEASLQSPSIVFRQRVIE